MNAHQLEVLFLNGVGQAEGVNDFGEDAVLDVRSTSIIEACDNMGACTLQAGRKFVDGQAQARPAAVCAHVFGQLFAEGVMGLVYIDTKLAKPLELLEALIGGECFLAIQLVALVEIAVLLIDGARGDGHLATRHEEVEGRFGLVLPFQDNFLGVGDDQVEAGPIQDIECHACLIQEMKADIGIEPAYILGRDDTRLLKSLDLAQRLEHRRIRREDQGVVAIFGIFREFVGENELVEDAGGHENGFARAHSQCEDIVGIVTRVCLQVVIYYIVGSSGWFLKHAQLSNLTESFIFCDNATF